LGFGVFWGDDDCGGYFVVGVEEAKAEGLGHLEATTTTEILAAPE